jgi:hypothetical protein
MPTARGIRAGAAYVELFADDSRLIRGLGRASRRLKAFGAGVEAMGAGLRGVGMSMIGLGAALIAPLLGAARVFSKMGDDLADMSVRTGVSVEALSELGFAARQSGSDLEGLEIAFKRMQKAIVEAAKGSKGAAGALAHLGLTVGDLEGLSPEEQFKLIADRISKIEDPTIRAAAALQLFGRSGAALLPMIENGAAGIEALQEQARRLGLTISTQDAAAADAFGDLLDQLWDVVRRGVFEIGSSLAPTLTDLAHRIIDVVVSATDWVRQNRELIVVVLKLGAAVVVAGVGLLFLGYAISGVATIFTGLGIILGAAGTALRVIGAVLGFVLSPLSLIVFGVAALGAYLVWASGVGGKALAWLRDRFTDLKADALAAFGGISDALAAGDIALAAKVLWLALKLEWARGILWLNQLWQGWKNDFLDAANAGWVGVVAEWLTGTRDIRLLWAETWATLQTVAVVGWGFIMEGIFKMGKALAESWALLMGELGLMTPEQLAKRRADIEQNYKDIVTGNVVNPVNRAIARIESELQTKRKAIAEGGGAPSLLPEILALIAAEKDLKEALAQARAERGYADLIAALDAGAAPGVKAKFGGLKDLMEDVEKRTVGVRGTFNPVALGGLGVADRLADWAQKTAKNTKKIADWTDEAEATFE